MRGDAWRCVAMRADAWRCVAMRGDGWRWLYQLAERVMPGDCKLGSKITFERLP